MYGNFTDEWLGQLINQVIPQKNRKALALAKSKLQPAKVQTSSASISVTFVPPTSHSSSNSFDLFGGALSVGGGLKTVSLLSDNQFNFANSGQTGESVPKTNLNFFSAPAPSVQALVPETSRTKHRKSEHPQKSKNADTIFPQTSNVSGLNFSAADFRGAESVCRNAAASSTAFQAFISLCVRADLAAISLIWNDLTSNHTSCIQKLCKPAQACNAWFCACGRHTRVDRAFQPLLGACVVLSTTAEDKSQATDSVRNNDIPSLRDDVMYFLPLSPCRSDLQTAVDASQTYVLPMVCEVSISDRWEAFMKLLSNAHMQKAIFHSQLALLPIIHGCEVYCPQRGAGAADIQYLVDPKVAAFLCSTAEFCDEQMMELPALLQEHHIPLPEDSPDDDGSKSPMGRVARMLKATQVELRAVLALQQSLSTQLSKLSMLRNYVRVEMPLVRLLALMEYYGVRMDIDELTQLQDTIEREITNVTQAAYAAAGEEFNLASPDQVAHILYNKCKVKPDPKAASGSSHLSTGVECLRAVETQHPLVPLLLKFRALSKVHSTYDWRNYLYVPKRLSTAGLRGIAKSGLTTSQVLMSAKSHGRIHSKWNQQQTRTGRLSSSEPNQQQVPNSKEVTSNCVVDVRRLFKAPEGYVLVSADYAQIEMRVLAHFCNDKNMQALFRSSDTTTNDIYLLMAASVFAKPLNQVTKTDRNRVKTVSLGIIYGIGVNQIMSRLDLQQSEAQHMKDLFFKLYPGVRSFMASVKENVRKSGYVSSLLSYRRYLPDINSTNTSARAKAERSAINSVIQGSASDILKMAMLQVDEEVRRWQQSEVAVRLPRLIMSIHDEVIYEVHVSHQVQFVAALRHILEQRVPQAFNLKVPLTVTIAAGPSWGELQPIKDPATYEMCAPCVKSGPSIVNRPSDGAASHAFDTAFEENTSTNTSSNHNNKTLAHLRGSDYTSINAPKFKSTD